MPKISQAQGASHEGVIAEHDADLRDEGSVEVQESLGIEPQERPGEDGGTPEGDGAYAGLTGAQLTAELEKRGLAKSGTKAEQIARLEEDDAAEDDEDDTEE